MLGTLAEKINDNRFLRLMRNMLEAGYLEDWKWGATLSGVPQGGVVSPILSNIYLHRLDTFAETVLKPDYTRGAERARNPAYREIEAAIQRARRRGDRAEARSLGKRLRSMPSKDMYDPGLRRLRYVRYADDLLLGFAGPRHEAEQIKARLAAFLRDDLKLELSQAKTLITHARQDAAAFLGYEVTVSRNDRKATNGKRSVNGIVTLRVPRSVIKAKSSPYLRRGQPAADTLLYNHDDYTIVDTYGARYRGIVQYYLLAGDAWRLNRLHWVMQTSLLKTLANKHRSTVTKMAANYKATIDTPAGPRKCIQASIQRAGRKPLVARMGGIPLQRQKKAVLTDRQPARIYPRKELTNRLLKGVCEICGQTSGPQVHQVRKLADLTRSGQPQPEWMNIMAQKRRKTLVVCATCHDNIHTGTPATNSRTNHWRAG